MSTAFNFAGNPHERSESEFGNVGRHVLVHKRDEEGSILIDNFTGQIIGGPEADRPEWAKTLVNALLFERTKYYVSRLGDRFTAQHRLPEMYAYEDLSWNALDETKLETGEEDPEVTLEADLDFRLEVLHGFGLVSDTSPDAREEDTITGVLAEAHIATDQMRTAEENAAYEASLKESFEAATKTGTSGD